MCRAEIDGEISAYEQSKLNQVNAEIAAWRTSLKSSVTKKVNEHRLREMSRVQEWLLNGQTDALAAVDETVKRYRKEEESRCDREILTEKECRKAIMRSTVDQEMEEERKEKMAAMEAELARMKHEKEAQLESDMAALRHRGLTKVNEENNSPPHHYAGTAGIDFAHQQPSSATHAVTGPGAPANASGHHDEDTLTQESDGIEGDKTLVNETAKSPRVRGKTPRGMRFQFLSHLTLQAVRDIKYTDSSTFDRPKAISLRLGGRI